MTKQLHPALLFITFIITVSAQSQIKDIPQTVDLISQDMVVLNLLESSKNVVSNKEKVFSYNLISNHNSHDHAGENHFHGIDLHDISLIDIISSDEGSDFNCSGGFCMDKSHFHKRGLTLKKQLFDYFMKISC
ncbi:hypothetical protein [uncultured Aquimarina sp.]|uniref:hypothetical protein n=1 Tax=uncultured Aquimarina sp. TaxID=575652 RepID=UPI00261EBBEE|nr:hypothetical protein [uncultured Aquimarina sp.]